MEIALFGYGYSRLTVANLTQFGMKCDSFVCQLVCRFVGLGETLTLIGSSLDCMWLLY